MKIRSDFVTNSSSSSFVCIGVFSEELQNFLKELVAEGKAVDVQDQNQISLCGNEACSYLFYENDGVFIYQQLFGEYIPLTSRGLNIGSIDPESEYYSPKSQQADQRSILRSPVNTLRAISVFFKDLTFADNRKIEELVEKATDENSIGCRVFFDETDSCDERAYVYDIRNDVNKRKKAKKVSQSVKNENQISSVKSDLLAGAVCCLTGDFEYGSKDAVKAYIESLGGTCSSSVTLKTNKLIIGARGSDNYSHGAYGKKYVAAKARQNAGADMEILKEQEFFEKYHFTAQILTDEVNKEKQLKLDCPMQKVTSNSSTFTDVTISEGCEEIGDSCFLDCKNLNSITLPSTLRKIGNFAFMGSSLVDVVIPEGCEEIGDWCFSKCKNLNNITLPSTLRKIGESAFCLCTNLTNIVIPEGCEEIGDWCFSKCKNLNNITLPSTLRKIGKRAFYSCTNLTNTVISEGCEEIGAFCFDSCKSLNKVILPSTLRKLGYRAFSYCTNLTNIVIPEGCEEIEEYCFMNCKNLNSITLPSTLRKIGKRAFEGSALVDVVIPEGCRVCSAPQV